VSRFVNLLSRNSRFPKFDSKHKTSFEPQLLSRISDLLPLGFLTGLTTVFLQRIVLSRIARRIEMAQQTCFFKKSRDDRRFLPAYRAAVLKGGILGQRVIEHLPRPLPAALTGPVATAAERVWGAA
jgi:hypothetical protein